MGYLRHSGVDFNDINLAAGVRSFKVARKGITPASDEKTFVVKASFSPAQPCGRWGERLRDPLGGRAIKNTGASEKTVVRHKGGCRPPRTPRESESQKSRSRLDESAIFAIRSRGGF